jgi:hypothetical protein
MAQSVKVAPDDLAQPLARISGKAITATIKLQVDSLKKIPLLQ